MSSRHNEHKSGHSEQVESNEHSVKKPAEGLSGGKMFEDQHKAGTKIDHLARGSKAHVHPVELFDSKNAHQAKGHPEKPGHQDATDVKQVIQDVLEHARAENNKSPIEKMVDVFNQLQELGMTKLPWDASTTLFSGLIGLIPGSDMFQPALEDYLKKTHAPVLLENLKAQVLSFARSSGQDKSIS